MTKVSVVIPYFQRAEGILRRALTSIFAQDVGGGVQVEVIVVDDQSPSPPEIETSGLARPGFSIAILKRPNGGPAQARNTGLDATAGADFVAFLDSDDSWGDGHLGEALKRLRAGAQFYFANNYYDDSKLWFSGLAGAEALCAAATAQGDDAYQISRDAVLPFFLEECLAHTSTVVFDARRIGKVRFDETQVTAGEDYLFWFEAITLCDEVAFSMAPMVTRGRGIDLYRGALAWDDPECVRRLYYALVLHKKIQQRFSRTPAERRLLTRKIDLLRRGITYLFLRNLVAHARPNARVACSLFRTDAAFWFNLPRNIAITMSQKLNDRLEFPIG